MGLGTEQPLTSNYRVHDPGDLRRHYFHLEAVPYWGLHAAAAGCVWRVGWSWSGFGLAIALYLARMFFVTGVYHRYFAHRAYRTSRTFQFLLAFVGATTVLKGVLGWPALHRHHHRFSDTEHDLHSPLHHGYAWAHQGWTISKDYKNRQYHLIRDFAKYPELVWMDTYHLVPVVIYAGGLWAGWGFEAFVWGFLVSTVLLFHGTFSINSLAHAFGTRRFATPDNSRNNWLLALLTMGEGWHNNHHHYPGSARQGFYWWELDLTYYLLKLLSWTGLIWDLRTPPRQVLDEGLRQRTSR